MRFDIKHKSGKKSENFDTGYEKVSFSDIDEPLRIKYIQSFGICGFMLILGIIFSISVKSISLLILIASAILLFAVYTLLQVLTTLNGNVYKVQGTVVSLTKEKRKNNVLRVVLPNDYYLEFFTPHAFNADEGDPILAYIPLSALYQKSESTYSVNTYYLLTNQR